ncbi:MAG: MBL fold metallo-hydrolase [Spirochaetota bacterium]
MVPQVSADPAGIIDYPRRLEHNQLYFAFGGGVGRFGTNFTVFHLNNTTIWIDVGSGFANHHTPGMDKNLPNRQLLLGFPPTAIFLTHGHEDHIGALPHLTEVIPAGTPLFASPFTTALVTARLKDRGIDPARWNFRLIEQDSDVEIGPFRVSTFFMPHSIPQCFSVGLEAVLPEGKKRIYFSSDFKMRGSEVRHKVQNIKKFAPVDFLFVDSTGSLHEGETTDEREVDESLERLIARTPGRIFITTFASQVERIKNIVRIASGLARPVGFLGRSLKAQWEAAFISREVAAPLHLQKPPSYTSQNAVWLVAGCQADKNSSFSRLTHGTLAKVRLKAGDTLVYSASMIPGNEGKIYEALNLAADAGVRVVGVSGDTRVHASGHGKRGDIERLISYLKPRHILPVHGDPLHFHAFLDFIDQKKLAVTVTEGHRIYALGDAPVLVESVPDETCLVEAGEIHFDTTLYRERNHLAEQGICFVALEADRFAVSAVSYVGVMSGQFEKTMAPRLLVAAQQAAIAAAQSASNNREKKLRDFLGKLHEELIGKNPYIKIVTLRDSLNSLKSPAEGSIEPPVVSGLSRAESRGVEPPVVRGIEPPVVSGVEP